MIFDKFIGITALCDFLKPCPLEKKKRKTAKRNQESLCSFLCNTDGYFWLLFWTPKDFSRRRTVEKERNSAGWCTWDEARAAAANRENWRHSVEALCATRHKEARIG